MDLAGVEPDPLVVFRTWLDDVLAAGLYEPMAMALATAPAGPQAQPVARHVLLRGVDERGFTWVTNSESRKGRHLAENPRACLLFPWYAIQRQVIVTGGVVDADDSESDEYFATRPRESQIAAWASDQSRPIPDRATLERAWADYDARFAGADVPRPPHWLMQRLVPATMEFWLQGAHRMHDRFQYERAAPGEAWVITRLAP